MDAVKESPKEAGKPEFTVEAKLGTLEDPIPCGFRVEFIIRNVPMQLTDLETPALVLDRNKLDRNKSDVHLSVKRLC